MTDAVNLKPFEVDGRTAISVSGGRTSGYMLWLVLQANGGKLPDDCVAMFANTGKEADGTLRFVREMERRWDVPITWVEYRPDAPGFEVVNFDSASRNGEPFEALIRKRRFLPNSVIRFCTTELKIRAMFKHLRSLGWLDDGGEVDQFIGIRADEQRRVAKMLNGHHSESKRIANHLPLNSAGISVGDVMGFWTTQPFNLELSSDAKGRTTEGNCDLCFLKPAAQVLSLIRKKPESGVWWARQESYAKGFATRESGDGWRFRTDRASYEQMMKFAADQRDIFDPDEEAIACFCGD